MKKFICCVVLSLAFLYFIIPAMGLSYTAPPVPDAGMAYMPQAPESFGEGVWKIIRKAIENLHPSTTQTSQVLLSMITVMIIVSLIDSIEFSGKSTANLAAALAIGLLFIEPADTLIQLAAETIVTLHEYGKLLLPVMTSALAAQGGATCSIALYAGTSLFCSILSGIITYFLVPAQYIYLALSIASSALNEPLLRRIQSFVKWFGSWSLKTLLYIFTGYLTITGVVSGAADASAIKAARLAISGTIPVVGGILSDASETILISAGILKNAAGVYGLLAILSVSVGPFLQISVQYLAVKLTAFICTALSPSPTGELVDRFSDSMGMLVAMTGTMCLLLLISTVCFMKGLS